MIACCKGCIEELEEAYWLQEEKGWNLANTAKGIGIDTKGHLAIIMVDDKGKVQVW